jgi:hypothetical protein
MERGLILQELKVEKDSLKIKWEDSEPLYFNLRWLRDSCTCKKCLHEVTLQRRVDTLKVSNFTILHGKYPQISRNLKTAHLLQNHDKQEIEIIWNPEEGVEEEHLSIYSFKWLNSIEKPRKKPTEEYKPRIFFIRQFFKVNSIFGVQRYFKVFQKLV